MADVLDIARIEKELQDINQQRSETRDRLDALRPGRGRGRGPPGGGRGDGRPFGVFSRLGDSMNGGPGARDPSASGRPSVFDRLYSQGSRGSGPAADRDSHRGRGWDTDRPDREAAAAADNDHSGRHIGKRLSSRISSEVVGPAHDSGDDFETVPDDADRERAEAPSGRKRLLSAVMVNGQARQLSAVESVDRASAEPAAEERPLKRPTLAADDKTKRRAARMFGTLLVGTLQKFQTAEQAFKKTDTAQRRAEMEKRAHERAEAEAQRLREQAAAAAREERESKLNALHDLNLQAEIKALELRFAKRIQQRQQLTSFCITTTQPPLYWLPKETSKESLPLLQESEQQFESWKQQQLQELEAERAELVQAAAAKREAALARLAARRNPAAGGDEEGVVPDSAGNGAEGSEDEGAGEEGEDGREEDRRESGRRQREHAHEQQYSGDEGQQQQGDEEMQDAGDEGVEVQQQEEEEEQRPRLRRSRRRGSDDEDEERLLSSDDEDA